MLTLPIPKIETFNEETNEFLSVGPDSMTLEHSLVSIAKWEAKWQKPFVREDNMTMEELVDYVRCMTVKQPKDPNIYDMLRPSELQKVMDYIGSPMTAYKPPKKRKVGRKKKPDGPMTAENFYFLMIHYGIPLDYCDKWHFNRLLALIRICENDGGADPITGKPMTYRERQQFYEELNNARRAKTGSKG